MERTPKPGEWYRHVKKKLYQIVTVAEHTETGEKLVVYQALYGTFAIYARPLAMFLEEIDVAMYPDADQRHRFEKVEPEEICKTCRAEEVGAEKTGSEEVDAEETGAEEADAKETGVEEVDAKETGAEEVDAEEIGVEETGAEEVGAGEGGAAFRQDGEAGKISEAAEGSDLHPLLLSFVEAQDLEEKLEILSAMEGRAGQEEMDILYEALELPREMGNEETQMNALRTYLQMRKEFEGGRLRGKERKHGGWNRSRHFT